MKDFIDSSNSMIGLPSSFRRTEIWFGIMMPNQISVLRNDEGKPIIEFDESIKSFINDLGIKSSHVSLSDDGGYAVAFVILEA